MAAVRTRALGLVGALVLLVALDAVIARVNVFTLLLPKTQPSDFFGAVDDQLIRVVSALYGDPTDERPVVLLGNSQLDAVVHPLEPFADAFVAAGAPHGTRALALTVYATVPVHWELIARQLEPVRPGLVLFGLGARDFAVTAAEAREGPVTRALDIGWRDGLLPPPDLEARFDRWARTAWRLYRYHTLFRDMLLFSSGPRVPRTVYQDTFFPTLDGLFALSGPERAATLRALRPGFERGDSYDDVVRYVEALRGPDYLPGLRRRWHAPVIEPIQLEALRRAAVDVRRAGGRPAWLLLPENPILERDPEIGAEVRARSDAVTREITAAAETVHVPLLDFRRVLPPRDFRDLNHCLATDRATLMDPLATALAARGLLAD